MEEHDDSAPHLSHPGPPDGGDASAPAAPAGADRYVDLGVLGSGGMGEVRAVHDRRLGRQVAQKAPRADQPGAVEALRREAAITAGLEHPGIVPVYDAGEDEHGQPWYTMRMVRGRSLRAVIAACEGPAERLALVRPILSAVEAVAYAHARGVVHCDLKAPNVLLGEHGEVQVVDWGLAASGEGRTAGGGTPATMAPEQARGEPATRASDVWGLGMVLVEALSGRPPHPDLSGPELRAAVAAGQAPWVPTEGVPPDLRTIVLRCLQADPGQRYADAGALAADLRRFLDGRLVEAHDYTLAEHLWRVLARHRLAVAVGSLAVVVLAGVVVTATVRVVAERDAARAAEVVAEDARARSDAHLAQALVLAARSAAAEGSRPEAEVLAAHALALAPSPEARGVLAAFGASPRPIPTSSPRPPCEGLLRAGPDARIVCIERQAVWGARGASIDWRLPIEVEDAAFAGAALVATVQGNRAQVLDPDTGAVRFPPDPAPETALPAAHGLHAGRHAAWLAAGRQLVRLDATPSGLVQTHATPCGDAVVASVSELHEEVGSAIAAVACGADRVVLLDDALAPIRTLPFAPSDPRAAIRQVDSGPGGNVAIGTDRGEVAVVDLGSDGVRFTTEQGAAVAGLGWTDDGSRLLVHLRQGAPRILDGRTGAALGRLPAAVGAVIGTRGETGLVFAGRGGEAWDLQGLRPLAIGEGAGITDLATDSAATTVVVTRGDGRVEALDLASGAVAGGQSLSTRPLKGVTRMPAADGGPDGFAVVGVEGGVHRLAADFSTTELLYTVTGRRLATLGDALLVLRYQGPGALLSGPPGAMTLRSPSADPRPWFDVGVDADNTHAAALADDGTLWLLDAGPDSEPRSLGRFPTARAVDATAAGGAVLRESRDLVLVAPDGAVRRLPQPDLPQMELALSPDGSLVATGGADGVIRIVDLADGRTVALLEGHRELVATLSWLDDDRLLSGSWDGTVRQWALGTRRTPASTLVQQVEAAWGMDVAQALEAAGP